MMAQERLVQAFNLMKSGEKKQAQSIVIRILKDDPKNINALWLLSILLEDEQKVIRCLQRILLIDTDHQHAKQKLQTLQNTETSSKPKHKVQLSEKELFELHRKGDKKSKSDFLPMMMKVLGFVLLVIISIGLVVNSISFYSRPMVIQNSDPKDVAIQWINAQWQYTDENLEIVRATSCEEVVTDWAEIRSSQTEAIDLSGFGDARIDYSQASFATVSRSRTEIIYETFGTLLIYTENDIFEQDIETLMETKPRIRLQVINNQWLVC
ncbi:MAG: hypothetical protein WBC91_17030 [Phototrophicaceae bacterium]